LAPEEPPSGAAAPVVFLPTDTIGRLQVPIKRTRNKPPAGYQTSLASLAEDNESAIEARLMADDNTILQHPVSRAELDTEAPEWTPATRGRIDEWYEHLNNEILAIQHASTNRLAPRSGLVPYASLRTMPMELQTDSVFVEHFNRIARAALRQTAMTRVPDSYRTGHLPGQLLTDTAVNAAVEQHFRSLDSAEWSFVSSTALTQYGIRGQEAEGLPAKLAPNVAAVLHLQNHFRALFAIGTRVYFMDSMYPTSVPRSTQEHDRTLPPPMPISEISE
jgi:hypothetical protein